MAIRKIVTLGDDSLRKHCKPQEKFDKRLAMLLKDMADTMYKAEGVGLAAPQVGILRRIAVVDVTEDHSGLLEMVNPEIIEREGEQTGREGCLSIPGVYCDVVRPKKMTVRYYNEDLQQVTEEFDNFAARMIQHELSHLDGDLFTDHAAPIRKKMISSKLQNIQKGKVHPHYNSKLK